MVSWIIAGTIIVATILADIVIKIIEHLESKKEE